MDYTILYIVNGNHSQIVEPPQNACSATSRVSTTVLYLGACLVFGFEPSRQASLGFAFTNTLGLEEKVEFSFSYEHFVVAL